MDGATTTYDGGSRHRTALQLWAMTLGIALGAVLLTAKVSAQQTVQALAERAEQLEGQGKLGDAAATYREILRIDPHSIAALNRLGALYVRQRQFAEGIKHYQQALEWD